MLDDYIGLDLAGPENDHKGGGETMVDVYTEHWRLMLLFFSLVIIFVSALVSNGQPGLFGSVAMLIVMGLILEKIKLGGCLLLIAASLFFVIFMAGVMR